MAAAVVPAFPKRVQQTSGSAREEGDQYSAEKEAGLREIEWAKGTRLAG